MNATQLLMDEHQFILKYLDLMERYSKEDELLLNNVQHFSAFIHEFADKLHHAKEEDSLFKYLAQPNVLTHCNPIPQMLYEHTMARELVKTMETTPDINALKTAVQQYINLLRQHIFKEDNILYPMAEQGLSDNAKQALLNEYQDTNLKLNSTAIWQDYQNLYDELNK